MLSDRGQAHAIGVLGLIIIGAAVVGGALMYEEVDEGYVGVEWYLGDVTETTYQPGPHFIHPLAGIQWVEVRPRTYTMSDSSGEGEKAQRQDAIVVQSVNGTTHRVDVTIRYRIHEESANQFVSEWHDEEQMERRLIRPTVRSQMRDEAAAIPTGIIYQATGRERLAEAARESLESEFSDQPIVLEAVQVRDVTLPSDYAQELEQREVAKAEIERREHEVEVERREAERKRIEAEANAEVIRVEGEAIRNNPEVLKLREIEAIKPTDKVIIGGGGGGIIVDVGGTSTSADRSQIENTTAEDIIG